MKKSILDESLNIAMSKTKTHPEYYCYLHFSFVVQNNKIVEWGRNNKGVPAIHYGYHDRINDKNFRPKTHSEIDAYKKAKGLLDGDGFEMVNIRLTRLKQIRLSKPCNCCYRLLKALGCKVFYYSSEIGFLTVR